MIKLFIVFLVIALASCVYPSTQTYYEVVSTSGKVTPSGCTQPSNRKEAISREIGNVMLYVTSDYDDSGNINISMQVSSSKHDINVDVEQIKIDQNNNIVSASSSRFSSYDSGNNNDKFPIKEWVYLSYSIDSKGDEPFNLLFGSNAIVQAGVPLAIEPISFKKVTKTGFYLLTINC